MLTMFTPPFKVPVTNKEQSQQISTWGIIEFIAYKEHGWSQSFLTEKLPSSMDDVSPEPLDKESGVNLPQTKYSTTS